MILLALKTCDRPKYIERRMLIEETWATRLPLDYDFQIFTGARLGVPDDYSALNQKTKAIAQYAVAGAYDWVAMCDDDCFIRCELLEPPPAGVDYAGFILEDSFCSGGFYWLSRRAFRMIAAAALNPTLLPEDRWVASVLDYYGIKPANWKTALKPCTCGRPLCFPVAIPEGWAAFILDMGYSAKEFMEMERRYAPSHL